MMKIMFTDLLPKVTVGTAFLLSGRIPAGSWQQLLALFGCYALFNAFFIQKYPTIVPLKWGIGRIKPGQKIEIEGR